MQCLFQFESKRYLVQMVQISTATEPMMSSQFVSKISYVLVHCHTILPCDFTYKMNKSNGELSNFVFSINFQDIAAYIKKEFDKKYNPTWHCIVGRNFGSYVTHETRHFIYFYLGQVAILLFKSG